MTRARALRRARRLAGGRRQPCYVVQDLPGAQAQVRALIGRHDYPRLLALVEARAYDVASARDLAPDGRYAGAPVAAILDPENIP